MVPQQREQRAWSVEDQDARVARALRESFVFTETGEGTWVCESESGASYLVRPGSCSCEDAQYRAQPAGGKCKHIVALGQHLISIGVLPAPVAAKTDAVPVRRPTTATENSAEESALTRIFG